METVDSPTFFLILMDLSQAFFFSFRMVLAMNFSYINFSMLKYILFGPIYLGNVAKYDAHFLPNVSTEKTYEFGL